MMKSESIAAIKLKLADISTLEDPYVETLRKDNRQGVQKLLPHTT